MVKPSQLYKPLDYSMCISLNRIKREGAGLFGTSELDFFRRKIRRKTECEVKKGIAIGIWEKCRNKSGSARIGVSEIGICLKSSSECRNP